MEGLSTLDQLVVPMWCEAVYQVSDRHSDRNAQRNRYWKVVSAGACRGAHRAADDDPAATTVMLAYSHRSLRPKVRRFQGACDRPAVDGVALAKVTAGTNSCLAVGRGAVNRWYGDVVEP